MNVNLHRTTDQVARSASADRAAHRVVQEALTNAARHAPGAVVDIHVELTDGTITVTASNLVEQPARRSEPAPASQLCVST
ncbi:hypothetical protein NKG94_22815 [Micromonospora sp. M12]